MRWVAYTRTSFDTECSLLVFQSEKEREERIGGECVAARNLLSLLTVAASAGVSRSRVAVESKEKEEEEKEAVAISTNWCTCNCSHIGYTRVLYEFCTSYRSSSQFFVLYSASSSSSLFATKISVLPFACHQFSLSWTTSTHIDWCIRQHLHLMNTRWEYPGFGIRSSKEREEKSVSVCMEHEKPVLQMAVDRLHSLPVF